MIFESIGINPDSKKLPTHPQALHSSLKEKNGYRHKYSRMTAPLNDVSRFCMTETTQSMTFTWWTMTVFHRGMTTIR